MMTAKHSNIKFHVGLHTLLLVILFCISVNCQSLKLGSNKSNTYAVVVGISDYQNDDIPDLQFAHKDAEAFVSYLKSNSGGNLEDKQIKTLINQEATTAAIAGAMDWLIEVTKEGDEVYIYFSGHGDVETKTAMQHGFLLSHDSPPTTYIAGAYPLFYLQSVVSTLSITKKIKVLMFMDACHSGKLAGSSIGGTEANSAVLAKQFGNEIKVLSCQPNEYSLEGDQWGGGRGVFSFHLIEGLMGLADKNDDFQVNLLELERYLEDNVFNDVSPASQIPMSVGNKSNVIAFVDEAQLIELVIKKESENPMIASVDLKSNIDEVEKNDSIFYKKYEAFSNAIEDRILMKLDENRNQFSADEIYKSALELNGWEELKSIMKRSLAVALQEEAQFSINKYLSIGKSQIASNSFDNAIEINENNRSARYLHRADELLGSDHYMHRDLKSKEKYFIGISYLHIADQELKTRDSVLNCAQEVLNEGLTYRPNAPHILVELANVNIALDNFDKAIIYAKEALELSPKWPIPYDLLSAAYHNNGDYEKSIEYARLALELVPDFENAFFILINNYSVLGHFDKIISITKSKIEKQPNNLSAYLELGRAYMDNEQYSAAIDTLLVAKDLAPKNSLVYSYLGEVYSSMDSIDLAHQLFNIAIEMDPHDPMNYHIKGSMYTTDGILDSAKIMFSKIIEKYPLDGLAIGQLGLINMKQQEFEKAFDFFAKAISISDDDPINCFNFFCYYHNLNQHNLAYEWLEKAFEHGFINFQENQEIIIYDCFQEIKQTQKYKSLLKTYAQN